MHYSSHKISYKVVNRKKEKETIEYSVVQHYERITSALQIMVVWNERNILQQLIELFR